MSEKKNSISRKSILRLCLLGIVMFIGIGLTSGLQMYRQNLDVCKDAEASYAFMLAYQLGAMLDIDEILQHEEEICAVYNSIKTNYGSSSEGEAPDGRIETESIDGFSQEAFGRYKDWYGMESFILGFGNICDDIQYAYVVVPIEDEVIYAWDSDMSNKDPSPPFEHAPYSGKEKEHLMAIMSGEKKFDFFTETIDGELVGTSLSPVPGPDGETFAVAAIDMSISTIRYATLRLLFHIAVAILLIMLASIAVYHYIVTKQIIHPIVKLTRAADSLVKSLKKEDGEPLRVDVHTGDEIDVLARSFERMDQKLLDYIRENAVITAEKERIVTELSLAARIQKDMLPSDFPPFPDRKEIDLYASMKPALDVGGDFYDFFLIDENRLGLVMADVSGKGIPAALFMMMSRIMVQNFALTLDGPGTVLERVNDQICGNTAEEMFVTVWLGVLDLRTGILRAANAGHEYPVVRNPGGDFELIKDKHGLVVGGMEGYPYKEYELKLLPGSRLFLYTDGLPEATNKDEEMFGTGRMLEALNEVKEGTPREILEHVTESVEAFAGSAPQFDDTTMLCLYYHGE